MWGVISLALNLLAPVLAKFIPDPQKQAEVQMEMQKALLDSQAELWKATAGVMMADSQQDDLYTKRARPSVVYWSMAFATAIGIAGMFGHAQPMIDALRQIPTDLWTLMTVGIGAFGFSRSIEKGVEVIGKKR